VNPIGRTDSITPALEWRVHPARERAAAASVAVAVMAAMACLSAMLMQSIGWGLLAFAVQAFALRRFLLPSDFRVDARGVTACNGWQTQRYRWSEIRRFLCDAQGGYLSTRRRRSLLDLFRGMHLIFGENRDAVVTRIREHLRAEAAS
jgi:hypothetical protein